MKHLIYILCFFVFALVQVIIKNMGIILGGLPTALLCGLTYWCASTLCKAWDKHKEKKAAESTSRQAAPKAFSDFLACTAVEHAEFIKANKDAHSLNLNDPEYGLVPEKPVYCCYVDGSKDYLNTLRTETGEKLEWNRRGSKHVDGINGMVDIYDSTLPNGQPYKTVYINMYADSNPITMPRGFILHFSRKKDASVVASAPAPSKPKARFCKLCGDPIDPVTRKCTGCRKQYFRLPVFTDKHYFIAATAVACAVVVLLLVALVSQRSSYEARIAELNTRVSELTKTINEHVDTINELRREISAKENLLKSREDRIETLNEKVEFFDNHAVFVLDDGSNEYHTYDCWYRKYSDDSFWIYNTEAAKSKGYKPCSLCCD